MSPLVALFFLCHLTYIVRAYDVSSVNNRHLLSIPPQKIDEPHDNVAEKKDPPVVIDVNSQKKEVKTVKEPVKPPVEPVKPPVEPEKPEHKSTKVTLNTTEKPKDDKEGHKVYQTAQMESGTLLRGVAVVVALTTLVIIYMALKTYCNAKGKQPGMVRKYGVRTRRSDIEMTPLPLDEDEEDETLFDVNSTHR